MSHRSCWHRLGIAHTTDTGAIRRAYAAKLKEIDLDRDADGFQALRDARDEAMSLASLPPDAFASDVAVDRPAPIDEDILWGRGDIAAELDDEAGAEYGASEPAPAPAPAGATADEDAPYHALYELLDPDTPERERWFPADDEAAAIRDAFDAILADPRMARIDFHAYQEQWLARVIALAWPTSEPIVEPAVDYFGWAAHAGEIGQDPAMDFAVARVAAAHFHRAIESQGHPQHGAWTELTKPANEHSRRSWLMRSKPINELLRTIRAQYPTLEGYLDPWRVSLWERPIDFGTNKWQLGYTFAAIILLNVLIRLPGCDPAPVSPPVPVIETLADVFGASSYRETTSIVEIRDTNPKLWGRLTSRLNAAKSEGMPAAAIITTIDAALTDHVRAVVADPPYPVLRSKAQFFLARANAVKATDWDGCVTVLFGSDRPQAEGPLPDAAKPALTELRRQALLNEPAEAGKPDADRAKLDQDVADKIRARGKLADQTFSDALMNRGAAKDRCETRIFAIQVALELPQKRGEPLLRLLAN